MKHTITFSMLLLLLLIRGCTSYKAHAFSDYYFKQLSIKEGLSQSTVRCILNDQKGYIWIGTKFGLNRFDGNKIKTYRYKQDTENCLPSDLIHFVAEDSLSNIWISTEKGLVMYDYDQDHFVPVLYQNKNINVRSFLLLPDGILFGGRGIIYKYDYQHKKIQPILMKGMGNYEVYFNSMEYWKNDEILIRCRWEGLWLYDIRSGNIRRTPFYKEKNVSATYIDSDKNLWISPYGKGLLCFSKEEKQVTHYTTNNSRLNNNIILDIKERNGNLWIATDGGGINILDREKQSFSFIKHSPGDIYSFPVNSVYSLYIDKKNNLWVGSIRGGLIGIREVSIKTYREVPPNNKLGLSESTISSLYEDSNGMIWAGTDGGGLNKLDPQNNTFSYYPETQNEKVASISQLSKNELILSFFGKGLYLFNTETKQLRPFRLVDKESDERIYHMGLAVNMNKFSVNKMHFMADKVYLYDIEKKTFSGIELINPTPNITVSSLQVVSNNEKHSYLFSIKQIFEVDHTSNTMKVIFNLKNVNEQITAVCNDNPGSFWIGTNQCLHHFDYKSNQIKTIETNLFHGVSSLISDKNGRLWIGTQDMLVTYLPEEDKFILLGESNGAYPNEYLPKPVLISQSGDIFMGGISGLTRISNDIKLNDNSMPRIELSDLILDGVRINQRQIKDSGKRIKLPWNYSSLVIKIMSNDEDVFRKKMFRYQITGSDKYTTESYDPMLTLHTLPYGDYQILVSCNMQDGNWSTPIKILSFTISAPWWTSVWFILCVVLLIIAIGTGIVISIFHKRSIKLKWEMKEHEQKVYEGKVRFLINISHELRTPLTLIYAPLKRMLNQNNLEEETQKTLTGIYKQTKRMTNIINMVLDIRKMEVNQDVLHMQPHELNTWVRSIAEDFHEEFSAKKIELKYVFDHSIATVSFDESKCEVVLSNFLMNALKYSPDNSCITLSTQRVGEYVKVSVSDEGLGLGDVDTGKLFTRFYQGYNHQPGSGIGLSYAKTLIELHEGKIGAVNNEGTGSTFFFELKENNAEKEIVYTEKNYLNSLLSSTDEHDFISQDNLRFDMKAYSLLIVEDESEMLSFLKEALFDKFKTVYTAENGTKALELIYKNHPDIIVSDVMMPHMNGFELTHRIKTDIEISHIPIILLTARNNTESMFQGYETGAEAYLAKPFDIDVLQMLIRNQLRHIELFKSRYRNYNFVLTESETSPLSNIDEKFLLKLNNLVMENLSNPALDVQYLTNNIGMSRSSLYAKMKALTGMSINDYINKLRIEKATQMLTNTDLAILLISEQTGFSSQRYFSTAFKAIIGCTPSQYRENHKTG